MKRRIFRLHRTSLLLGSIALLLLHMQCKKDGQNAALLDRSVDARDIDTTIFISFYDTTVLQIAQQASTNDVVTNTGIQTIIRSSCATANCHGGAIAPALLSYGDVKRLVTPGNPAGSRLWQMLTTHDLNKAMPPVSATPDMPIAQKMAIYNWIRNGANETPTLADYRPNAIRIITGGCTAQCHNDGLTVGAWARNFNLGRTLAASDTMTGISFSNKNGCIAINDTLISRVWKSYKDSVSMFYSNTDLNAAFKPKKTIGTALGPLNTYDNIIFDIINPKGGRSVANPYNSATASYNLLTRVDSTLTFVNPVTKATSVSGNMSKSDGHFTPSEIAIIKGWYFADPNIPDMWKYGANNTGIFKDKGGNMITKQ